jgi:hypothetical protein
MHEMSCLYPKNVPFILTGRCKLQVTEFRTIIIATKRDT